jgi:predicted RNA binding protein YcfA (HicA-like mRNA interferase family)/predicted RNase H-like HicB family nuclease
MKVREVIRLIERDGWFLVRTIGSHRQIHHPIKPGTVTVSGNLGVDMPKGTLNKRVETGRIETMRVKPRYAVVFERERKSHGAYVPDFPGCVAVASSLPRVRKLIREAIALHIEDMSRRGYKLPKPTAEVEYVEPLSAA